MGNPSILHCDMNAFYASVEALYRPELKKVPMAVGGDPEQRHGIVLAKNEIAKKYGVKTGEALWEARRKCPDIVFVPPNYARYKRFSAMADEIYAAYTDQVEPFGLDESWLDVSASESLFGSGTRIAEEIRARVKKELGITVSVGVSFNKIFAKLGSDMKKPDAVTVIGESDFRQKVWPLPVGDLLYVGPATERKLRSRGIFTVGDLARTDPKRTESWFGVVGRMLWMFANGLDRTPVGVRGVEAEPKSVGNSTTAPRDLVTFDDVRITFHALADSVAERLREQNVMCRTVQISVRDNRLESFERQCKLSGPVCVGSVLAETAMRLFRENVREPFALRSLGLRACDLTYREMRQLSFLPEQRELHRQEDLESAMDSVRRRFGHYAVQRAVMLKDRVLAINPKDDHTIHPVGLLR